MTAAILPITVTVTDRGVTVDGGRAVAAMSRFAGPAQRLTAELGIGVHTLTTVSDVDQLPVPVRDDILAAIGVSR